MHKKSKAWIYCCIDAPEDVHGMLKVQRKQLMGLRRTDGVSGGGIFHRPGGWKQSDSPRLGILFESRPVAAGGGFTGT